jgi:hypothetical protein
MWSLPGGVEADTGDLPSMPGDATRLVQYTAAEHCLMHWSGILLSYREA